MDRESVSKILIEKYKDGIGFFEGANDLMDGDTIDDLDKLKELGLPTIFADLDLNGSSYEMFVVSMIYNDVEEAPYDGIHFLCICPQYKYFTDTNYRECLDNSDQRVYDYFEKFIKKPQLCHTKLRTSGSHALPMRLSTIDGTQAIVSSVSRVSRSNSFP